MQSGSFTTLNETRDTVHSKEINKLVSGVWLTHIRSSNLINPLLFVVLPGLDLPILSFQKLYKAKHEKDKGKSQYNLMAVPPDVQHAIDVAKSQSSVSWLLHNCTAITFFIDFNYGAQSTGWDSLVFSLVSLLMSWSVCSTHCILSALLPNATGCL